MVSMPVPKQDALLSCSMMANSVLPESDFLPRAMTTMRSVLGRLPRAVGEEKISVAVAGARLPL